LTALSRDHVVNGTVGTGKRNVDQGFTLVDEIMIGRRDRKYGKNLLQHLPHH
jgi:hypothetical protein